MAANRVALFAGACSAGNLGAPSVQFIFFLGACLGLAGCVGSSGRLTGEVGVTEAGVTEGGTAGVWDSEGSGESRDSGTKGVQYFGYAFSGPYIDEVKDHTNLIHVSSDYRDQTDLAFLVRARHEGLKVALDLSSVFFPTGIKDFNLAQVQGSKRWAAYAARIAPYQDVIAAFYPVDEPYWNTVQPRGPLTQTEATAVLEALNQEIKRRFSQIPLAVVFAYPSVNDSLVIPTSYDWVGFDCYDGFDACGSPNLLRRSVPEFLATLRKKKSPAQRLILIPPAFQSDLSMGEDQIVSIVDRYAEVAATDPEVVAVIPFLWPDITGDHLAGRSMAQVVHRYRLLGAQLLGKGDPGPAPVPSSTAAPRVSFRGVEGAARHLFNRDSDDLHGLAEGVIGDKLFWCLTLNNEGSCLDLNLGSKGNWAEVQTSTPAWTSGVVAGTWELNIPHQSLQGLELGQYVIHLYDPAAGVRSMPHVIRLAESPKATISAVPGGANQTSFAKQGAITIRVHYPLKTGLYTCAEMQGAGQCTGSPGSNSAWNLIPGEGKGWTFDKNAGDWTTTIAAGSFADYPSGTYVVYFLDGGSGYSSAYPIQLVD